MVYKLKTVKNNFYKKKKSRHHVHLKQSDDKVLQLQYFYTSQSKQRQSLTWQLKALQSRYGKTQYCSARTSTALYRIKLTHLLPRLYDEKRLDVPLGQVRVPLVAETGLDFVVVVETRERLLGDVDAAAVWVFVNYSCYAK